jgi:CHAD domain-containing protein
VSNIEREVKLVAPSSFQLPDLTVAADGRPVAVLPLQRLHATYYDTADLRLVRWGITLRYRTGDDGGPMWTLKLPAGERGPGLSRRELDVHGTADTVPAEVTALLRGHIRHAPVAPVATLSTMRTRVEVRDSDGRPLLEVADDVVSALEGGEVAGGFREVEVEVRDDAVDDALLRSIVERLCEEGAAPGDSAPKVVVALGARAVAPPEVVPVQLTSRSTAGDVVRAAIASAVTRLLAHDVGARLGDDPEDVHQARVATRRLRSDLRTFRAFVDASWVKEIREELRWLAARLGAVRDTDVLLERLQKQARRVPELDQPPAAALLHRLSAERDAARDELLAALASDRYADLVENLVDAARVARLTPEAEGRAQRVLPEVVRRPWKHLESAVAALGAAPEDAQLHEVRIRAKRARYASEAVSAVIGKPAARLASALADVQSVLGDLQDAAVAEAWLRTAALSAPGAEAVVAGQLIAVQHHAMARARTHWRSAWKAASKKPLRSWLT